MGFDPYIAVQEQTLIGVKENIFRRLSEAEYLIFVDFKRERLYKEQSGRFKDTEVHRGSLFSNQELAIGTFLNTEVLAFQEKGVRPEDGILKFVQANSFEFSSRKRLSNTVIRKVRQKVARGEWHPNYRKELSIRRADEVLKNVGAFVGYAENTRSYPDPNPVPVYRTGSYYHLVVNNLHHSRIAHDCLAYLQTIRDLSSGEERLHDLVELKWKGVTTAGVAIPPGQFRELDAFHLFYDEPNAVYLGINPSIVDFTGLLPAYILNGPAEFELTFVVFSDNFSPSRATFSLRITDRADGIEFSQLPA